VIIGASSLGHVEQVSEHVRLISDGIFFADALVENLLDLEKPPLPDGVVNAIDEAYELVKANVANYWH
jgi:aflatoxin B1 aldehyde reductase